MAHSMQSSSQCCCSCQLNACELQHVAEQVALHCTCLPSRPRPVPLCWTVSHAPFTTCRALFKASKKWDNVCKEGADWRKRLAKAVMNERAQAEAAAKAAKVAAEREAEFGRRRREAKESAAQSLEEHRQGERESYAFFAEYGRCAAKAAAESAAKALPLKLERQREFTGRQERERQERERQKREKQERERQRRERQEMAECTSGQGGGDGADTVLEREERGLRWFLQRKSATAASELSGLDECTSGQGDGEGADTVLEREERGLRWFLQSKLR